MGRQGNRSLGQIDAREHAVQFVDRDTLAHFELYRRRASGQIIVDPPPQHVGVAPAARHDAMAGANVPAPC